MFNFTPMVRTLLLINIGMMFVTSAFLPQLESWLALYPVVSERFQPFQYITYMFLHDDFWHIFSNMLGLLVFGPTLEMRWGPQRFLLFWVVCGVGAGVLYSGVRYYELEQMREAVLAFRADPSAVGFVDFFQAYAPSYAQSAAVVARNLQLHGSEPGVMQTAVNTVMEVYKAATDGPMIGASGALFAVLFAFGYLFPNTELFMIPIPFPIKAKYLVFGYGALELYQGIHPAPGDNVAHYAHLAGMLFGFVLLKYWERHDSRFS